MEAAIDEVRGSTEQSWPLSLFPSGQDINVLRVICAQLLSPHLDPHYDARGSIHFSLGIHPQWFSGSRWEKYVAARCFKGARQLER